MDVGNLTLEPILDGVGRFVPTKSYRSTTPEQWARHDDLLDEDGLLHFAMGGFLLHSGDRVVLIDTGLGPRTFLGISGGQLLENLARRGVSPDDVTDVVFTHLHLDHVGWASHDGEAVFSNATYRCDQADWDHFMVEHRGEEFELLAPLASRFATWDTSGPLLAGLDVLDAPGHTPGSAIIVVSSNDERAMLLGDVVHCAVELLDPEWEGLGDVDPQLAKRTRDAVARELEASSTPAVGGHFRDLTMGRLLRASGRRRWVV